MREHTPIIKTAIFIFTSTLGVASGCGQEGVDDGGGGAGAGTQSGTDSLGLDDDSGTSTTDAPCESDDDCDAEQICHPVSGFCAAPGGSCAGQGDCQQGYYCDEGLSTCLPGVAGSPCETAANCDGGDCVGGVCQCSGFVQEQELVSGDLDIYFMFDRTASMDEDCDYVAGEDPPVESKACFATYAMSDYLSNVSPEVDTRLAFQFMSYGEPDGVEECQVENYSTPLVDLTELPVEPDHQMIQEISDESFEGGSGTQIEAALRGIFDYTVGNQTAGREMIGVLMTDGEPNRCDLQESDELASLIADHLDETGIRTFIIGMEGASEQSLEEMAIAGGAESHDDFCGAIGPPCHYWNVGDGSGDAIASALTAIAGQAAPLPCDYALSEVQPPDGSELDLSTLNVQLSQDGETTFIGNVPGDSDCPNDRPAWYYDDPNSPSTINLCPNACDLVTVAEQGAQISVVGGCTETVILK